MGYRGLSGDGRDDERRHLRLGFVDGPIVGHDLGRLLHIERFQRSHGLVDGRFRHRPQPDDTVAYERQVQIQERPAASRPGRFSLHGAGLA